MRLLSQTSADATQGDLSCFGDWAISTAADIARQSCTNGCNPHTEMGTRISRRLKITEFLSKPLWLCSLILNVTLRFKLKSEQLYVRINLSFTPYDFLSL